MISFDPIRPYLALIRVGIIVLLGLAMFIGGCRHGVGQGESDRAELERSLGATSTQLGYCVDSLNEVNAEAKRRVDLAAENEDRARKAQADAEMMADAADQRMAVWQSEFDAARRNPQCKATLEARICGITAF